MARANTLTALASKLSPDAIRCSGKMTAIVACLLGQEWTNPVLAEMVVTSDGFVLGRNEGDCGCNAFIGSRDDLMNNLRGLAEAAELTKAETRVLLSLAPAG